MKVTGRSCCYAMVQMVIFFFFDMLKCCIRSPFFILSYHRKVIPMSFRQIWVATQLSKNKKQNMGATFFSFLFLWKFFQFTSQSVIAVFSVSYLNMEGTEGLSGGRGCQAGFRQVGFQRERFRRFPFQNWAAVWSKRWLGILCLRCLWYTHMEKKKHEKTY